MSAREQGAAKEQARILSEMFDLWAEMDSKNVCSITDQRGRDVRDRTLLVVVDVLGLRAEFDAARAGREAQ